MKVVFLFVTIFLFFKMGRAQCGCGCFCDCGCGCCNCCDYVYTISTTTVATTTTTLAPNPGATAFPIPPVSRVINSNKISMDDYLKIQAIINGTIPSRARRYSYDLSAQLAADSSHYRHGEDEALDDDERLDKHIAHTTTIKPTISLIGAVNPQMLPGADYIPAPVRNLKNEEEAPETHRRI